MEDYKYLTCDLIPTLIVDIIAIITIIILVVIVIVVRVIIRLVLVSILVCGNISTSLVALLHLLRTVGVVRSLVKLLVRGRVSSLSVVWSVLLRRPRMCRGALND